MEHIVIIGNGIAGITTARTLRKHSDVSVTVISKESKYFFSRTALMYIYMGHMTFDHTKPYEDGFWKKNRIDLIQAEVREIDAEKRTILLDTDETLIYSKLVLATGSKIRIPHIAGTDLKGVQGLYSIQDLRQLEELTHPAVYAEKNQTQVKRAVIAGGGLIGIELAEMLRTRKIAVTMLVREGHYWGNVLAKEEGEMIMVHMRSHGVDVVLGDEIVEIHGANGCVNAVQTKSGQKIDCQLLGLTMGVLPNKTLAEACGIDTNLGILVDDLLQTSQEHIYAAGDCAELREVPRHRRSVEAVWYVGRMMGEVLGQTLAGRPTAYQPGNWFNSAKFFDIVYQVYGEVPARPIEGLKTFYWRHPKHAVAIRLTYDNAHIFRGIHSLGLPLRHGLIDQMLGNVRASEVVNNFHKIDFGLEFAKKHHKAIIEAWNEHSGEQLRLRSKPWYSFMKSDRV